MVTNLAQPRIRCSLSVGVVLLFALGAQGCAVEPGALSAPTLSASASASAAPVETAAPPATSPSAAAEMTKVETLNGTGSFTVPADWTVEREEGAEMNVEGRYQWQTDITVKAPGGEPTLTYSDGISDDAESPPEDRGIVLQEATPQGLTAAAWWELHDGAYSVEVAVTDELEPPFHLLVAGDVATRLYSFEVDATHDQTFATQAEAEKFLNSETVVDAVSVLKTLEIFPVDRYAWPEGFTPPSDPAP